MNGWRGFDVCLQFSRDSKTNDINGAFVQNDGSMSGNRCNSEAKRVLGVLRYAATTYMERTRSRLLYVAATPPLALSC